MADVVIVVPTEKIIGSLKQQMETSIQEKFQNLTRVMDGRLASNENSIESFKRKIENSMKTVQEEFQTFKTEMEGKFSMFIVRAHVLSTSVVVSFRIVFGSFSSCVMGHNSGHKLNPNFTLYFSIIQQPAILFFMVFFYSEGDFILRKLFQ